MDQGIHQRNQERQATKQRICDWPNRINHYIPVKYIDNGDKMNKHWIRQAIPEEHRGKLEKWAKGHHFMDVNGDINLRKAM